MKRVLSGRLGGTPPWPPLKLLGLSVPASPSPGAAHLYSGEGYLHALQALWRALLDAAQLLWRQHYPCELYTDKTLQEVIEAHKGEHIRLDYDWSDELGRAVPQFFVGLNPEQGSSFYDFVLWLVLVARRRLRL